MLERIERSVVYVEKNSASVTLALCLLQKLCITVVIRIAIFVASLLLFFTRLLFYILPITADRTFGHFAITFWAITKVTAGFMLQRSFTIHAIIMPRLTFCEQSHKNSYFLIVALCRLSDQYKPRHSKM